jgi:hypothetical protein
MLAGILYFANILFKEDKLPDAISVMSSRDFACSSQRVAYIPPNILGVFGKIDFKIGRYIFMPGTNKSILNL